MHGVPCQSQLINIPTGLGKTAAVVLAWLWMPIWLVYSLAVWTLAEQAQDEITKWIDNVSHAVDFATLTLSPAAQP